MQNKIFKYLEKAKFGYLQITTPCNNEIDIGDKNSAVKAKIKINDWSLIDLCLAQGDIGFGKAYIEGLFETDKIENVLLFFLINQKELEDIFHSNFLYSLIFSAKNLFKINSLKGSKRNIEYHYDLGNDFYNLWLDPTMSYSSAIFSQDNQGLIAAQKNKYHRILDNINQKGESILEIGCGWGGFIKEASAKGHFTKGLTLSSQQKLFTDNLIKTENIKAKTALQDYRLESEKFDNIVSIEMFEAVGKEYWSQYFSKVKDCLKQDGRALIQTITIDDDIYKKYLKTSDFIREFIFPGGLLPSKSIFENLAKSHGLCVVDKFAFASSYNKTLLHWLDNFNQAKDKILQLGYNEKFVRKWQFYLAYCAAGFYSNRTDVVQYSLAHD